MTAFEQKRVHAADSATAGTEVPVIQFGRSKAVSSDRVAVEEPLEIRLQSPTGERQVAVTMRTPGNDAELALGFLFTEGIIEPDDELSVTQHASSAAHPAAQNIITVQCKRPIDLDQLALERNFYMTSSCGVCGKASLEAIRVRSQFPAADNDFGVSAAIIAALPEQLLAAQEVFAGTGGIHGAALFDSAGLSGTVYEDVGRHNAVDKLIGSYVQRSAIPLASYGLLVSGRASFELVQKACVAGCAMLAAVGAPSSLAIELAWEANMTLIGFLRDGRFNIYTGKARVLS